MSAIEHLLEIDKDPKCQELLDLAHISSKRLYVLLNEILDHSKIESHQMYLEEETFKVKISLLYCRAMILRAEKLRPSQ